MAELSVHDGGRAMARGGRIQGYASRFGEADRNGDVVAPGAFHASLGALAKARRRLAFLWQHDTKRPIGVWDRVIEDATGLWVEGGLLPEVATGAEARALVAAGALDGLSIGYRVKRAEKNRGGPGRRLLELDLWEVSLVTFPMLPTARASLAPSATRPAGEPLAGILAGALASRSGAM
ncbi:MAG: HK97 family phage prohead protease [Pseudomonadota bacterium]